MEPGYVLFSPNGSTSTFLIDRCGRVINEWISDGRPGLSSYLLPNGDLLRTRKSLTGSFVGGGIGGIIERFDWDGNLVWADTVATETLHLHHDIAPLPNGNILAIAWEKHTAEEAIARGRLASLTPEEVWVTRILELAPVEGGGSSVVWQWSPWDHLVQNIDVTLPNFGEPAQHPGRFDVNYGAVAEVSGPGLGQDAAFDWLHVNSIDYHPERDEILLSSRNWNEVWVVDHSTTLEEAASNGGGQYDRGGELIWRWGNPMAYDRGSAEDQQFFGQHDARFATVGESRGVTVFNNGAGRPEGPYSSLHQLELPAESTGTLQPMPDALACPPAGPTWTYPTPLNPAFFSNNISGYTLLPSGHHLACEGATGRFFELDASDAVVWEYVNPMSSNGPLNQGENPVQNSVFRATPIPLNHPGIQGRDLTPSLPIEGNANLLGCTVNALPTASGWHNVGHLNVHPNPASSEVEIALVSPHPSSGKVVVYNLAGLKLYELDYHGPMRMDVGVWSPGLYVGFLHLNGHEATPPLPFKLYVE